jgi:hypothetical protein
LQEGRGPEAADEAVGALGGERGLRSRSRARSQVLGHYSSPPILGFEKVCMVQRVVLELVLFGSGRGISHPT